MELVLVSMTAISLVLAAAMGLVVLRLLREERQRSDARVALLAAAAGAPAEDAAAQVLADAGRPAGAESPEGRDLFAQEAAARPWALQAAAACAAAVLAATGALALSVAGGSSPATAGPPSPPRPVELLALGHSQEAQGVTIAGTVRNPGDGTPIARLTAAAFLLGPDGRVVASGRAAIDAPTLLPGGESPFVIKVPVAGAVARYRIGFRGADGSVIAHLDRRPDGASARAQSDGSAPWVR